VLYSKIQEMREMYAGHLPEGGLAVQAGKAGIQVLVIS
jgi:hypothetical protein